MVDWDLPEEYSFHALGFVPIRLSRGNSSEKIDRALIQRPNSNLMIVLIVILISLIAVTAWDSSERGR
jgi:hypothetical protein